MVGTLLLPLRIQLMSVKYNFSLTQARVISSDSNLKAVLPAGSLALTRTSLARFPIYMRETRGETYSFRPRRYLEQT